MFTKLLIASLKHRLALWTAIAVLTGVMLAAAVVCGRYSNDLAFMFPKNSLSSAMFKTMQQARLTQAIQLEVNLKQPNAIQAAAAELDKAVAEIQKLDHVQSATFRFAPGIDNVHDEILRSTPCHSSPRILDDANPKRAVQNVLKTLSTLGTPASMLRKDPFGIAFSKLNLLNDFRTLGGVKINQQYDFLTDEQAMRTVILIQADFPKAPAGKDIEDLFNKLRACVQSNLPQAEISLVSPLAHQLDNEHAVKRDIRAVSLTSIVVLLLLFVLVYRNAIDALWIPILPLIATVLVTGILACCFNNLCLFIIGISGGIAGLAVDQEIHVFSAFTGENRIKNLANIALPLTMSVLTSAAVFILVATTNIDAYVQLGVFAAATLLINLLLSLFLLPTLMKQRQQQRLRIPTFSPKNTTAALLILLWLATLLTAMYKIPTLKFDVAMSSLDGVSKQTKQAENDFQKRWRNESAGILAIATGDSRDNALENAKRFADDYDAHSNLAAFTPTKLWPTTQDRASFLKSWESPETTKKIQDLKKQLEAECNASNLPPTFFKPFFDALQQALRKPMNIKQPFVFQTIENQLVRTFDNRTAVTLFLPPKTSTEDMEKMITMTQRHPNVAIVDAEAFQLATLMDIQPRIKKLMIALLPMVLIPLLPLLKNPLQLIIVALPGLTAFLCFAGLSAMLGLKLNLVSLFASFMLTGLVIDYGVFALHAAQHPNDSTVPASLMLSAITTVLTSGALLASSHPVMFHTGMVIASGIAISAITALFIVPAVVKLLPILKRKSLLNIAVLLLVLVSTGCASLRQQSFPRRDVSQKIATEEIQAFVQKTQAPAKAAYNAQVKILWQALSLTLAINSDPAKRSLNAVFTAPNGPSIASFTMRDGKLEKSFVSDAVPQIAKDNFFNDLPNALHAIFCTSLPTTAFMEKPNTPIVCTMPDNTQVTFNGSPLRLTKLANGRFPWRHWQASFFDWDPKTSTFQRIVFRNYNHLYTITLHALQTK